MSRKRTKAAGKKVKHIRRRPKDLPIVARLFISNVCMILIPTAILIAVSPLLFSNSSSDAYLSALSAASNTYGSYSQMQWDYITNEILQQAAEQDMEHLKNYAADAEALGAIVSVSENRHTIYTTAGTTDREVYRQAADLAGKPDEGNWFYFGENGLAIVRQSENSGQVYHVVIVNEAFNLRGPASEETTGYEMTVRSIVVIAIIAAVFMVAMLIVTAVTAATIRNPIQKLKKGVEEVGAGNLYYTIDYNSTNELGQTAEAFNLMRMQLIEATELQSEREKAQKEMIAGAAHDLRTPLTSIKGYVEGLRDNIADTPEKRAQYLKIIYNSTLDMEKLLDDLLTYSKLNLSTIVLTPKKINICEYMRDCTDELKEQLAAKDFRVRFFSYCKDDVCVMLDPDNFARVIRNIVSNSVKYRSENTHGELEFRLTQYTRTVLLEIADNGIGVDKEELSHIFDSFYRADKARTRSDSASKNSSGLGLAICKQIVTLHGGSIWATSEKGQGLTIHISLPIEKEEDNEHHSDH